MLVLLGKPRFISRVAFLGEEFSTKKLSMFSRADASLLFYPPLTVNFEKFQNYVASLLMGTSVTFSRLDSRGTACCYYF